MPIEITMPRLSDTMEEGTLLKWRVKVGDKVSSGDVLAEVETDKATMELQAYDDGVVASLAVAEGQTLPVGQLILVLAGPGEKVEEAAAGATASSAKAGGTPAAQRTVGGSGGGSSAGMATASPPGSLPGALPGGGRVKISPLARKMAEEMGVALGAVKGSGPGGRIIKRDIVASGRQPASEGKTPAAAPPPQAAVRPLAAAQTLEGKLVPLSPMRKTIARRLVESKTTIPHFTVTMSVNTEAMLALRQTLNAQLEGEGIRLSVNDLVVRAVALGVLRHPEINASWTEEGIRLHATVNVGIAVALPAERGGGLVVPVLRDVQHKGLRQISTETRAISEKARTKGLTLEEMADGTIAISNLGMYGVEHFEAIINPPMAAILAVGASLARPVVRDGQVVAGQEMSCTLSADHRVIDGAMAAEYLRTVQQLLENPASLIVWS
ncbi:MAG: 2-oxo acid dehydrogenase subunit E2 [Phycisphaeraceae bacterium]|nr:2-oxo acid dehydrogenase subunit E2 [Phycisphaeraceae bacterium]